MTNISDLKEEQKRTPLLRLAFRPFFLFGGIFSLLAIAAWTLSLGGHISFSPLNGALWWHGHEMLFGFVPAIIAGFLLTAVQTWTGVPSVKGVKLLVLFLLWLSARLLIFINPNVNIVFVMLVDISFLPLVAFFLAQPLIRVKQHRNMIFLPVIALMTATNIFTYLPSLGFAPELNTRGLHSMILLTTLLVAVLGGRVIPMFSANGTKTQKVSPLPWLETTALGSLIFVVGLFLGGVSSSQNELFRTILGLACLLSAALHLVRILRWRFWVTLSVPLVWVLHFTIIFMPLGLMLLSIHFLFALITISAALHSLTVGVIGGMILAMMSRVSLGHTGRTLAVSWPIVLAFILIIVSALLRSLLMAFIPQSAVLLWIVSGACWTLAFACFVWVYLPILSTPRLDGRPG